MPDARAVWMMPTNVMSWLAIASKLIFSELGSPEVLCACKIEYAIVSRRASSGVFEIPRTAASASGTISVPSRRNTPPS